MDSSPIATVTAVSHDECTVESARRRAQLVELTMYVHTEQNINLLSPLLTFRTVR